MEAIELFSNFTFVDSQVTLAEERGGEGLAEALDSYHTLVQVLQKKDLKKELKGEDSSKEFCQLLIDAANSGITKGPLHDLADRISKLQIKEAPVEIPAAKEVSDPLKKYLNFNPEELRRLGMNEEAIEESRKMAITAASFEMMSEDLNHALKERHLEKSVIPGDGNCFYRAVSAALSNDTSMSGQSKYADYRRQTVEYMEAQINAFKNELEKASTKERIALEDQIASLSLRKTIASEDKEFAESQEIEALSHALGVSFVILSWHGDERGPYPIAEGESRIKEHYVNADLYSERPPIVLLHELNHYNLATIK